MSRKVLIIDVKGKDYSVDSIKRTIHLAFHGFFSLLKYYLLLVNSIFNRDFLKFFLATVRLIESTE